MLFTGITDFPFLRTIFSYMTCQLKFNTFLNFGGSIWGNKSILPTTPRVDGYNLPLMWPSHMWRNMNFYIWHTDYSIACVPRGHFAIHFVLLIVHLDNIVIFAENVCKSFIAHIYGNIIYHNLGNFWKKIILKVYFTVSFLTQDALSLVISVDIALIHGRHPQWLLQSLSDEFLLPVLIFLLFSMLTFWYHSFYI